MLDPQIVLEPVRDSGGRITDFTYAKANAAACAYVGVAREDLIGRSLVETFPSTVESGLLAQCVRCVETGEPVHYDDLAFDDGTLGTTRRYDIRGSRAGNGWLVLTSRDVTDRYETARRYRLLAENAADVVFSFDRDGRIIWISPSVQGALGAPPDYWIGREVGKAIFPDGQHPATRLSRVLAGGVVRERVLLVGADGVTHWTDVLAKPTYDADGRIEGGQAALRLIDTEVSAEQAVEEARQKQSRADERFRRSMDNAAVGMCLTTPDGRFTDVNDALCVFFGYDAATLSRMTWQELTAPDYLEADVANVARIVSGQIDSYRLTKQFIHADGHRIWGDLSVGCLRTPDGEVEWFIAQITDTTREVTLTQQLARQNELIAASEQQYRMLAENAGDVVAHVRDGRVVWISQSVEAVMGAPPEYWLGRNVLEFAPVEDASISRQRLARFAEGGTVAERVRALGPDGVTHWFSMVAKPFYDAEGRPDGHVVTLGLADQEVAAERAAEQARKRQARADERLRRAMDHAAVAMVLFSAEGRVEEVNDAVCRFFGYDAETLKQKTWQEVTGPLYMKETEANVIDILKGRIDSFRMITQYIHADGHLIWADHSVGCVRDEHGRVENFISQITDVTLVERGVRERLEFEEFLSSAIDDGRLLAYAQPIVDARTGQVVEEELLVRIIGPDGQVMVPGEFLPQAHRFALMAPIDRFMVARGIELARAGRHVAVNLSADSINDAATITAIVAELRQAGEAATRVSFEITETAALASGDVAERFSREMGSLGCRLALDDFGTGFGTFTELRGMALHKLKIDRSFVSGMLADRQDEAVVKAIVGAAREFGLLTTAEGVDDAATRARLIDLGVDQLQGYLIGVPEPVTTSGATNR
jgi:PAS domain S-box-containing protein